MTDKLQFPQMVSFWGGGRTALPTNVKELIMRRPWLGQWMMVPVGPTVTPLLRVRKKMFDFEEDYFYPAKDGIDMYHRYKEDIALFGEMGFKNLSFVHFFVSDLP